MNLAQLTAVEAVRQIAVGQISSEDLLVALLKRIDEIDIDGQV